MIQIKFNHQEKTTIFQLLTMKQSHNLKLNHLKAGTDSEACHTYWG
jgi:hypothetical protein